MDKIGPSLVIMVTAGVLLSTAQSLCMTPAKCRIASFYRLVVNGSRFYMKVEEKPGNKNGISFLGSPRQRNVTEFTKVRCVPTVSWITAGLEIELQWKLDPSYKMAYVGGKVVLQKNPSPPVDYRFVLRGVPNRGYLLIEIRTKTSTKYIASLKNGTLFLESNPNNRRAWFIIQCV